MKHAVPDLPEALPDGVFKYQCANTANTANANSSINNSNRKTAHSPTCSGLSDSQEACLTVNKVY